ncbi:MAG: hypothetical protein LUB59_05785 [Candidatus Gastranaerophilales bacterium]|nr:hypothetical protein [Candidatus Gastranaerophilales bacterium]
MYNGDMSVSGVGPVNGDFSAGKASRSEKEEAMFDFNSADKSPEVGSDGGIITRNADGSIKEVKYLNEDGSVYSKSTFNGNTETIYYRKDGKLAPFAEHVYDPATNTGTATPYVDGKLDTSYTKKYSMGTDTDGKPYLDDTRILQEEPAQAGKTLSPSQANAKFANVQFNKAVNGGYGNDYDQNGRIANKVYTDSSGNVEMYTEYSYRDDGTIDTTRTYSLKNGEFKLTDEVQYSADNKTAVGQSYSIVDGSPHNKINYTTEMTDGELQLVFKGN